ncbi:hypothetical protein [Pseudanabaena sp. FACHB-2040]|uniref:hypothetical protein n=1 Tax=Pseudanabaena sp. FACHB-2040 TaxID=2692859 RepID=UPI001686C6BC|nr:hypothetical protein [Pseudanabaena sp. FACHB-2040]MBD2259086.1 hypothetical protein [Pseudanabaena sp. FACHB-2040]
MEEDGDHHASGQSRSHLLPGLELSPVEKDKTRRPQESVVNSIQVPKAAQGDISIQLAGTLLSRGSDPRLTKG